MPGQHRPSAWLRDPDPGRKIACSGVPRVPDVDDPSPLREWTVDHAGGAGIVCPYRGPQALIFAGVVGVQVNPSSTGRGRRWRPAALAVEAASITAPPWLAADRCVVRGRYPSFGYQPVGRGRRGPVTSLNRGIVVLTVNY